MLHTHEHTTASPLCQGTSSLPVVDSCTGADAFGVGHVGHEFEAELTQWAWCATSRVSPGACRH